MSATKTRRDRAVDAPLITFRKVGSMVWMWLAFLFLVVGWLSIVPIYSPPHWSAVAFLATAVVLFAASFRHTDVAPLPRRYLSFLLPLGFSIVLIPWPYNVGSVFLSAALIVITPGKRSPLLRRGAIALGASGLVMLLVSAVQPVLLQVFARSHGAPWAAEIVRLILSSVGAKVSVGGSVLHMQTFDELVPINVTYEALPEAGDDLVSLLEQRIVHELQMPVGDREFHHVEFVLVVLEHERGDLVCDVS